MQIADAMRTGEPFVAFGPALVAVLLFLGAACPAASDEIVERVLARVLVLGSGDIVTETDVAAARDLGLVDVAGAADPSREILSRLIDRLLMLAEVDRYAPPEPSAEAVDGEVRRVRARFVSSQAFDAALARVGMDDRYLRETLRQNLRIRAYLEQRFTIQPPAEDEVAAYYRDHPEAFRANGQAETRSRMARDQIVQTLAAERRQTMIDDWVTGLRRRATITEVDVPTK